jgi:hypothetical protein
MLSLHIASLFWGETMSRLSQWFGRLVGIKGRKAARYRAYRSEALVVKLRQIQQEQGRGAKKRSG